MCLKLDHARRYPCRDVSDWSKTAGMRREREVGLYLVRYLLTKNASVFFFYLRVRAFLSYYAKHEIMWILVWPCNMLALSWCIELEEQFGMKKRKKEVNSLIVILRTCTLHHFLHANRRTSKSQVEIFSRRLAVRLERFKYLSEGPHSL